MQLRTASHILCGMKSLFALDRSPIVFDKTMREKDIDGRMFVSDCNISKACINPYRGSEIPNWVALGLDPNRIYKCYRDPAELEAGAESFNGVQLLIVHRAVSATQPEQRLVVGSVYNARFRAPYLMADLAVWTQDAVNEIERHRKEELSCGYRYRAVVEEGFLQGERFDIRMVDIIGNHVALVEEGRAGPDVVVPDSLPPEFKKMRFPKLIAMLAPFLAMDADIEALDAELEKVAAKDAKEPAEDGMPEGMDKKAWDAMPEEEKEKERAKDKKARDKKAADKKAKDEKAAADKKARDDAFTPHTVNNPLDPEGTNNDKAMDAALKARGVVTVDQMNAAVAAGVTAAVKRTQDLTAAREEVRPFVGAAGMAFDSAESTYEHALKHLKIAVDGVHPSAYRTILLEVSKSRTAAANPGKQRVTMAMDANNQPPSLSVLFPTEKSASPTIQ